MRLKGTSDSFPNLSIVIGVSKVLREQRLLDDESQLRA